MGVQAFGGETKLGREESFRLLGDVHTYHDVVGEWMMAGHAGTDGATGLGRCSILVKGGVAGSNFSTFRPFVLSLRRCWFSVTPFLVFLSWLDKCRGLGSTHLRRCEGKNEARVLPSTRACEIAFLFLCFPEKKTAHTYIRWPLFPSTWRLGAVRRNPREAQDGGDKEDRRTRRPHETRAVTAAVVIVASKRAG